MHAAAASADCSEPDVDIQLADRGMSKAFIKSFRTSLVTRHDVVRIRFNTATVYIMLV